MTRLIDGQFNEDRMYEACMNSLRKKIKNSHYDNSLTNYIEGWEEGIKVAMSIVSSHYNPDKVGYIVIRRKNAYKTKEEI